MDNVSAAATKESALCNQCGRAYLVPKNGSAEMCPDCVRLIRLGIEPPANWRGNSSN